jgi:hypothetical protein
LPFKTFSPLILALLLITACGGGGRASTATPSPTQSVAGLPNGLIAYATPSGIGILDPTGGKSMAITAPFPAGAAFRITGPVWGPAPGVEYPVVYFTVHDDRPAESRDSAGVVPYDWLFRIDPFAGTIQPVSASQDSASEGPIGLAANHHYLALTVGCCAAYEVDALDLTRNSAPMVTLARPTDPVTFFTEGIAPGTSGLIAVRAFSTGAWYWLNADAHVLNPFPLKLGPDDGPIAVSPDGSMVAVALPTVGSVIEPINSAVPLATPSAVATESPSPPPKSSPSSTPTASVKPRNLVSGIHPDGLDWSPDGKQIVAAAGGELELFNATPTGGSAPVAKFIHGGGVTGVAWSPPIEGKTLSMVKRAPGPQTMVDSLIAATKLPAAADTPDKRPFTKVYLWEFDSSRPSPISSITDATPQVLAKYPPLNAGVVIHHWAPLEPWALLGGCRRYRVVITGSIAPIAATIGLNGSGLCSNPSPTPTASPS